MCLLRYICHEGGNEQVYENKGGQGYFSVFLSTQSLGGSGGMLPQEVFAF